MTDRKGLRNAAILALLFALSFLCIVNIPIYDPDEIYKYYWARSTALGFVPYNLSESISDVLLAYVDGTAAGCAGLKKYSDNDVEIKRVWVEPDHRGKQIATKMMDRIEEKARMMNFRRAILQTRPIMTDAVGLYERRGYKLIENYPPYDKLDGAICMALSL